MLVPSLLQIVLIVDGTIRVPEGYQLDVVGDVRKLARTEIVCSLIVEQGMSASDDVNQHGLSGSIWTVDGKMFTHI